MNSIKPFSTSVSTNIIFITISPKFVWRKILSARLRCLRINIGVHKRSGNETRIHPNIQRSLQNFKIGDASERMPDALIRAFGILKKAAAMVNMDYGLDKTVGDTIIRASNEVGLFCFSLPGHWWVLARPFPIGCMADGFWYSDKYECERGCVVEATLLNLCSGHF